MDGVSFFIVGLVATVSLAGCVDDNASQTKIASLPAEAVEVVRGISLSDCEITGFAILVPPERLAAAIPPGITLESAQVWTGDPVHELMAALITYIAYCESSVIDGHEWENVWGRSIALIRSPHPDFSGGTHGYVLAEHRATIEPGWPTADITRDFFIDGEWPIYESMWKFFVVTESYAIYPWNNGQGGEPYVSFQHETFYEVQQNQANEWTAWRLYDGKLSYIQMAFTGDRWRSLVTCELNEEWAVSRHAITPVCGLVDSQGAAWEATDISGVLGVVPSP